MFKQEFTIAAAFIILLACTNCTKKATLPIPKIQNIVFLDAYTVQISTASLLEATDQFNILATDLQGENYAFLGFTESPIVLNTLPAGNAYTFQIQLMRNEDSSEFSKKSPLTLASATQDVSFNRIEMLQQINKVRLAGQICGNNMMPAVEPLVWNDLLETASEIHSLAMDTENFFGHTNPTTMQQLDTRLQNVNYPFRLALENIAKDYTALNKVMEAWILSEPHCKNLMNASVKEVAAFQKGIYWTQVFGKQ